MKIIFQGVLCLLLSAGISAAYAEEFFRVQQSVQGTSFVINGNKFTARNACHDVRPGDVVRFVEGSPHGYCLSAVFVDLRTRQECSVWCH